MKVSKILEAIAELEDQEINLLINSLNHGMWDEWDCSLNDGLKIGFGGKELAIAANSGMYFARHAEEIARKRKN